MTKETGGPAFPSEHVPNQLKADGISVRDYFAAKAMQGWFASYPPDANPAYAVRGVKKVAELAYDIADAMLEVRNK